MGRTYLGDGLYAEFDGWGVWLHASNWIRDLNSVYLEPAVFRALCDFVDGLKAAKAAGEEAT